MFVTHGSLSLMLCSVCRLICNDQWILLWENSPVIIWIDISHVVSLLFIWNRIIEWLNMCLTLRLNSILAWNWCSFITYVIVNFGHAYFRGHLNWILNSLLLLHLLFDLDFLSITILIRYLLGNPCIWVNVRAHTLCLDMSSTTYSIWCMPKLNIICCLLSTVVDSV